MCRENGAAAAKKAAETSSTASARRRSPALAAMVASDRDRTSATSPGIRCDPPCARQLALVLVVLASVPPAPPDTGAVSQCISVSPVIPDRAICFLKVLGYLADGQRRTSGRRLPEARGYRSRVRHPG